MSLRIKSTRAAILVRSRDLLVVDEIQLPKDLSPNQILVEVISSGICGAQINEIDASKGPDKYLPHLLGHEGFAKVLEVGGNVKTVRPGDYVVMHWRPGSGIQAAPAEYMWRGRRLNSGWVTTFNKHCVVSENRVTKIFGTKLDKYLIPLLGCALTTAYGVLKNDAEANESDSILIIGAGGVGLAILKIAKLLKINHIVVVDTIDNKLALAHQLGASRTVKFIDKFTTAAELSSIYKNSSPTIAIDTSGDTSAIELCYEFSAPKGRVILVGVPKVGTYAKIYTLPLHFGKVFKGSHGGGSKPQTDIQTLLDLILNNSLDLTNYPIQKYALEEINTAIHDLRNGVAGRMIIDFEL